MRRCDRGFTLTAMTLVRTTKTMLNDEWGPAHAEVCRGMPRYAEVCRGMPRYDQDDVERRVGPGAVGSL